jgi:hypothetical protein
MMILRSFPTLSGAVAFTACAALAAVTITSACSSSGASSAGNTSTGQTGADGGGTVGCDGQGDTYTANLAKPGAQGVYTFTLARATPAPPALNGNAWTLKIADKSGAAPSLAQVVVYPFMPLMGHGSNQTPTIAASAGGTFAVTDIDFFMPGLWTVTLSVTAAGDAGASAAATIDKAVYTFCVE